MRQGGWCHSIVVQLLTKLMNLMILFEYVPDSFGLGIMVPVPKASTGSSSVCTEEFRGISLNAIISKLFEHCLFFRNTLLVQIFSSVLNLTLVVTKRCIQLEKQLIFLLKGSQR